MGLKDKLVVLNVGYLIPRKGVDNLIRAFQRVSRPGSVLIVVGEGPERSRLESLVNPNENIRFVGYLEGDLKWRYYASADVFVVPTYHDPWPQVINEAMFFGLPIITTERDGSSDELIRDNGLVVPAGDVEALSDALDRLLSNESHRQEMGRRSEAIISRYTMESACDIFLRAIHSARDQT